LLIQEFGPSEEPLFQVLATDPVPQSRRYFPLSKTPAVFSKERSSKIDVEEDEVLGIDEHAKLGVITSQGFRQ
jgi:hypothetical protein